MLEVNCSCDVQFSGCCWLVMEWQGSLNPMLVFVNGICTHISIHNAQASALFILFPWVYCIAGNFQRRILSRISKKWPFCGENFRGMLKRIIGVYGTPQISWRKLSQVVLNPQYLWMFSPSNVFRYTVSTDVLCRHSTEWDRDVWGQRCATSPCVWKHPVPMAWIWISMHDELLSLIYMYVNVNTPVKNTVLIVHHRADPCL